MLDSWKVLMKGKKNVKTNHFFMFGCDIKKSKENKI